MYLRMIPKLNKGMCSLTYRHFPFGRFLSAKHHVKRGECLAKWLKLDDFQPFAEDVTFVEDLKNIAAHVDQIEELDFSAYALLNHRLLKDPARTARETIIEAAFAKLFNPSIRHKLNEKTQQHIRAYQSVLKISASAELEGHAFAAAWAAKCRFRNERFDDAKAYPDDSNPASCPPLVSLHEQFPIFPAVHFYIDKVLMAVGASDHRELFQQLAYMLTEGLDYCDSLVRVSSSKGGLGFLTKLADIAVGQLTEPVFFSLTKPDWVLRCLHDRAASTSDESASSFVDRYLMDAATERNEAYKLACMASVSAVEEGRIVLSPALTEEAHLALAILHKAEVGRMNEATRQWLQAHGRYPGSHPVQRRHPGRAPRSTSSTDQTSDSNAEAPLLTEAEREAWSVEQYVRWIEGPTDVKSAAALDVKQAVRRSAKSTRIYALDKTRAETSAKGGRFSQEAKAFEITQPIAIGESDAVRIIQQGLRKTAQYLIEELDDLKVLGERKVVALDPDERDRLRFPLEKYLQAEGLVIDELDARLHFEAAWNQCLAWRGLIEAQVQSELLRKQFETALNQALRVEQFAVGKETGGRIPWSTDAPLSYWSRIHQDFHNRLIDIGKSLARGPVSSGLQSDEALALYVTASSRTQGAAFCVSVHLWRRRTTSLDAPPTVAPGQKMDTAHWYDTHIPCGVLHVHATPAQP